MIVSTTKRGKEIIYRSEGTRTIDPFIGKFEDLSEFVQNAIAILNIAGEGVLVEGVGRLVQWSTPNGPDSYHIIVPKETS
jgi:hypothetical protein